MSPAATGLPARNFKFLSESSLEGRRNYWCCQKKAYGVWPFRNTPRSDGGQSSIGFQPVGDDDCATQCVLISCDSGCLKRLRSMRLKCRSLWGEACSAFKVHGLSAHRSDFAPDPGRKAIGVGIAPTDRFTGALA